MSEAEASIFVSYRRDPDQQAAGRLHGILSEHFEGEVFMDIDSIDPGVDFQQKLGTALAKCQVFLAVIGKGWLTARNSQGQRRLDDASDFVRLEIATALARDDVRVIPLLVDGAPMPRKEDLPPDLQALASRNAVELRHASFDSDVQSLIQALEKRLRSNWQQTFGIGLFVISLLGYGLATFLPAFSDHAQHRGLGLILALVLPPAIAMTWVSLRSRRLPTLRSVYTHGLLSYARIPATLLLLGIGSLVVGDAKIAYARERVVCVVVVPTSREASNENRIHLGYVSKDTQEIVPIDSIDLDQDSPIRPYLFHPADRPPPSNLMQDPFVKTVGEKVFHAGWDSLPEPRARTVDGVEFDSGAEFQAWFGEGELRVPIELVVEVRQEDLAR